ncbi:MAG: hypothetical protein WBG76_06120 [Ornithinimicrobium sp.]
MAFIRRVRTASGATAGQIAEYAGGRQRIIKHLGSAHTEAELGVLLASARELLAGGQGVLDVDVEPEPAVVNMVSPRTDAATLFQTDPGFARARWDGPGQVVGTDCRVLFEALAGVYADLGFEAAVGDEVFRDLVIARVVEPTSLLDVARVLTDLGRRPGSYSTLRRTLARVQDRGYRDQVATVCFEHATTSGDVSVILYDVTTLLCRRRHNNVYADLLVMPMFEVSAQVRGAVAA